MNFERMVFSHDREDEVREQEKPSVPLKEVSSEGNMMQKILLVLEDMGLAALTDENNSDLLCKA